MKEFDKLSKSLDRVTEFLIEGLTTDGAHHKQYFLEMALVELCGDAFARKSKIKFSWEGGIAP